MISDAMRRALEVLVDKDLEAYFDYSDRQLLSAVRRAEALYECPLLEMGGPLFEELQRREAPLRWRQSHQPWGDLLQTVCDFEEGQFVLSMRKYQYLTSDIVIRPICLPGWHLHYRDMLAGTSWNSEGARTAEHIIRTLQRTPRLGKKVRKIREMAPEDLHQVVHTWMLKPTPAKVDPHRAIPL